MCPALCACESAKMCQAEKRSPLAAYGLGICDGAAIVFRLSRFALKLNRTTEVERLTSSRTIANTLLAAGHFCLPKCVSQSMLIIVHLAKIIFELKLFPKVLR